MEDTLSREELAQLRTSTSLTETQLQRLYKRFRTFDKKGTGVILKENLGCVPALASNPLVDRVLAVMTSEGQTGVRFADFAKAVSVLDSHAGREEKLRFTFKMYDMDNDGKISNKDLYETLRIMVGVNLTGVQLQQIVDKTFIEVDADRDGFINFEEFE
ncbi:protein phosphatase 3, regulatory subunit, partial [Angomonas deanei]